MKYWCIGLIAIIALFTGCSDSSNSLISPNINQKEIVQLPESKGLNVELERTAAKSINGEIGGKLSISYFYLSLSGLTILNAELTIPAGAFPGTQVIKMTTNDKLAVVDFYPAMNFDIPLSFDYSISGLNLYAIGLNEKNVSFDFISPNGNTSPVDNDGIILNLLTKTIRVENARLEHFSRYGFTKHKIE